jgi:hypothetical protein
MVQIRLAVDDGGIPKTVLATGVLAIAILVAIRQDNTLSVGE